MVTLDFYEFTRIARRSDMRSKHAAMVVKNGAIVSTGHNRTLGSKKMFNAEDGTLRTLPLSRHAEEDALRNADQQSLRGATLYVIRWGVHDHNPPFMNSKPCKRCMNSIMKMKKYGLKTVFYSIDSDEHGRPIWEKIILN